MTAITTQSNKIVLNELKATSATRVILLKTPNFLANPILFSTKKK